MSLALAGRFLTTGPPGKSQNLCLVSSPGVSGNTVYEGLPRLQDGGFAPWDALTPRAGTSTDL